MRYLIGAIISLVLLALVGAVLFRAPLAERAIERAMVRAGLDNPSIEVTALGFGGARLENLTAGNVGENEARDVAISSIDVKYSIAELMSGRRVKSLSIGPGYLRLRLDDQNEISIGGWTPAPQEKKERDLLATLPFGALKIDDLAVGIESPRGNGDGKIAGSIDKLTGGEFQFDLQSDQFGGEALSFSNIIIQANATINKGAEARLTGVAKGDIRTPAYHLQNFDGDIEANFTNWSVLLSDGLGGATGDATFTLNSVGITAGVKGWPRLVSQPDVVSILRAPLMGLEVTGGFVATFDKGKTTFVARDRSPLVLVTDQDVRLDFTGFDEDPVLTRMPGHFSGASGFVLKGVDLDLIGEVRFSASDEQLSISGAAAGDALTLSMAKFGDLDLDFSLRSKSGGLEGEALIAAHIKRGAIGRMQISDAPINAPLNFAYEKAPRALTLTMDEGACVAIDRARIRLEGQRMVTVARDAQICEANAPLAVISLAADNRKTLMRGALSAAQFSYRLGDTSLKGLPPDIDFTALYQPDLHKTSVTGAFSQGRFVVNEVLVVAGVDGVYEALLDSEALSGNASFKKSIISETRNPPFFAPVIATGKGRLANEAVTFDFILKTPRGASLGVGTGHHAMVSGAGSADVIFDRVEFEKDGLQPKEIVRAVRGTIGETTGAVGGKAGFAWAQGSEMVTSAAISIDDLTFRGPGRIVNVTENISGDLIFESLRPIRTDGLQTLQIGKVDLSSLVLENGAATFSFPGDNTIYIQKAEFPWFGGAMGAYDATASFSGDTQVLLSAQDADLRQMLEFADMDGLSGEGILSGVLPLVIKDKKATIANGVLKSVGPGIVRYEGQATDAAAKANDQAQIAFDVLRDLSYDNLEIGIDGPLDGSLKFEMFFEGTGPVEFRGKTTRIPVKYTINLEAALLDLLNQAYLSQNVQMQIERAQRDKGEENP